MRRATVKTIRGFASVLVLAAFAAAAEARPVLRVGISDDYAPFSRHGQGFDVDVACALAGDLGMRVEWVRFRWPELREMVGANRVDVVMSGITWKPERAVVGVLSRAVARGGACVVGDPAAGLVAVNRGGFLESWARRRYPADRVVAFDDNLALPVLLEGGAAAAFVTDSFEIATRARIPGAAIHCEPPRDRKVYWIAPARSDDLAPRIDGWLATHERRLETLRGRWFGEPQPRDDVDDLVDRLARRLAMMPAVAAWKRAHGRPIEDPEREARVLGWAEQRAHATGLRADDVRRLFEVQIDLAKAIERRASDGAPALDLETEIRPALLRVGDEIVARLAALAPLDPARLGADRLVPLGGVLEDDEVARLKAALVAVRRGP